ncbi:MAG: MEKHLA domain-containing protein, partial [Microcystis panniformis]
MLIFNSKAVVERRGFRPKIFDEQLIGRSLLRQIGTGKEQSKMLFYAPFVLVSHGTQTNPIFNYGNRTALDLWGLTWPE